MEENNLTKAEIIEAEENYTADSKIGRAHV